MEKFSYALEFYYRKIFDLKNVNLFSKKVNEATKVENYFSKKILNLEYLREYIIKSYLFEPELEEVDRINYIKGLIYASDIINYEDALKFFADLNENLHCTKKMILWEQKNYTEDTSDVDFLHGMYSSAIPKYIEIRSNIPRFDNEDEYYEAEQNFDTVSCYYENTMDFEELPETVEPVSMSHQLFEFKNNVPKIIDEIIKRNHINKNDSGMVRLGAERWLTFYLSFMEHGYDSKIKSLEYENENLSDCL